jgi:hypothetical protein
MRPLRPIRPCRLLLSFASLAILAIPATSAGATEDSGSAHVVITGSASHEFTFEFRPEQTVQGQNGVLRLVFWNPEEGVGSDQSLTGRVHYGMGMLLNTGSGTATLRGPWINASGVSYHDAAQGGPDSAEWRQYRSEYYGANDSDTLCALAPSTIPLEDLRGTVTCHSLHSDDDANSVDVTIEFRASLADASPTPEPPAVSPSIVLPRTDGGEAAAEPTSRAFPTLPVAAAAVVGLGIIGFVLRTTLRPASTAALDLARGRSRSRRRDRTSGGHASCQAHWTAGRLSVSDASLAAERHLQTPLHDVTSGWSQALAELENAAAAFAALTPERTTPRRGTVAARRAETLRRILVQALDEEDR